MSPVEQMLVLLAVIVCSTLINMTIIEKRMSEFNRSIHSWFENKLDEERDKANRDNLVARMMEIKKDGILDYREAADIFSEAIAVSSYYNNLFKKLREAYEEVRNRNP